MARKQLRGLLLGIWIVNALICLTAVGVYAWYNNSLIPADAASVDAPLSPAKPGKTLTPKPKVTLVPPPTQRPTITLWPTPSPGPSVTAMAALRAANIQVIGYSVEKRPLEVYHYGAGPVHKLIVAGIHGGYEWNTIALADELVAYLNDHPEHIPADTTLYLLHDLNPDGLARGKTADGRANANNVDLNHNWPYNWASDWSRDGCFNERILSGGSGPGSEPEVQALANFIVSIRPVALISYHSAALGIFPGGKPNYKPSIKLAKAVAEVSDYPYPPINTGCDYTGNLTDWAANTRGIPSIDIELSTHNTTDFDQNLRVLQAFLDWGQ